MNQSFVDFKDRLTKDADFYQKFKDINNVSELLQLAAEEGYSFTEKELIEETVLSDAELASAAGGVGIAGGNQQYAGIIGK